MPTILPELSTSADNFSLERLLYAKGYLCVAGCDEAGRGPLAGPVVAACVVLPSDCDHSRFVDSKILTHRKRIELQNHLHDLDVSFGIGIVSEQKIDEINILQASLLAMKRSVENLTGPPLRFHPDRRHLYALSKHSPGSADKRRIEKQFYCCCKYSGQSRARSYYGRMPPTLLSL